MITRARLIVTAAVAALVALFVCWILVQPVSEDPSNMGKPTEPPSVEPPAASDIALQRESNESWGDLWLADFPDAERPEVEVVQVVDFDQWAGAMADCMTAAGYDTTGNADHTIGVARSSGDEAAAIAVYVCHSQYPMAAKYLRELTEGERGQLYDYWVSDLLHCLAEHGIANSNRPPSRTAFIVEYENGTWTPYTDRLRQVDIDEFERIALECPRFPAYIT